MSKSLIVAKTRIPSEGRAGAIVSGVQMSSERRYASRYDRSYQSGNHGIFKCSYASLVRFTYFSHHFYTLTCMIPKYGT
ncbi:hypothetical protein AA700_0672 [Acidiphilium acidophilum DSM 700]|nr:hypothetical protein AA700_0672 [Acidiphilium acidophilum DSM 700]